MNTAEALTTAVARIEDLLKNDDGQAWKEAEKVLPQLHEAVAKAAPAVPQGEPVACLVRWRGLRTPARNAHDGQDHFSEWSDWRPETLKYGMAVTDPSRNSGPEHLFEMLPLVLATPAAPSQPVTLTDEEIKRNWSGGACPPWGIKFARAIIAALREKGGK